MYQGNVAARNGLRPRPDLAIVGKPIQEIGVFGQAFFPSRRRFRFRGPVNWAVLLVMAACGGDPGEPLQSGRVLSLGGAEGRWVGPVAPVDPNCGPRATGLMSIGTRTFAFDPFQSTGVIRGDVSPSGDFSGNAVRPVPGSTSITMDFVGRLQQAEGVERIVGTLTSGRCHWTVTLLRG